MNQQFSRYGIPGTTDLTGKLRTTLMVCSANSLVGCTMMARGFWLLGKKPPSLAGIHPLEIF